MPSKYVLRNYYEGGYYHVLNRGLNKQDVFIDDQDILAYLRYLAIYTLPLHKVLSRWPKLRTNLMEQNMFGQVSILAYCIMPNHFHLLMKNEAKHGIPCLMHKMQSAYSRHSYLRYGAGAKLMHGRYRAVEVATESSLLQESRYIHLNPLRAGLSESVMDYKWSSLNEYVTSIPDRICDSSAVLSSFGSSSEAYLDFVEKVRPEDFLYKPFL